MQLSSVRNVEQTTLNERRSLLTPEIIQKVEKKLKIDDGLDGISGKWSPEEKNVIVAVEFHDTVQMVLDGLYFYQKMLLQNVKNSNKYSAGFNILQSGAIKMGASDEAIDKVFTDARADYLIEANPNAEQLIKDLGEEKGKRYVLAIAECWHNPVTESRNKVLELAKALVPTDYGPFPIATFKAFRSLVEKPLADRSLFLAVDKIKEAYMVGEDYKSIQLEQ